MIEFSLSSINTLAAIFFSHGNCKLLALNPVPSSSVPPGQPPLWMWSYRALLLPPTLLYPEVLVASCFVVPSSLPQTLQTLSLFPLLLRLVPLIHFKVTHIERMRVSPDLLSKSGQVPKTDIHIQLAKLILSDCLKYSLLCLLHKAFQIDPRRVLCFFFYEPW